MFVLLSYFFNCIPGSKEHFELLIVEVLLPFQLFQQLLALFVAV